MPTSHRHLLLPVVLVLVLLGPSVALGDIAPPVTLHFLGDFPTVESGVPFAGTLRLGIDKGFWVDDVYFSDQSDWELISLDRLPRTDPAFQDFELRALPLDPGTPIYFDVLVDGQTVTIGLDLSPSARDQALLMGRSRKAENFTRTEMSPPARSGKPNPPTRVPRIDRSAAPGETPRDKSAEARWITVKGNWGIERSYEYGDGPQGDGAWVGLEGAAVHLYDVADHFFDTDKLLDSGYTDDDGNFQFTYYWNPVMETDDDPDFMVVVALESPENKIVEPSFHRIYEYNTPVTWAFQGTVLDLEARTPDLQIDRGRMSLFTQMQRCYDFLVAHGGEGDNLPALKTIHPDGWPRANGSVAHFPDEWFVWSESTPFHERMHHWARNVGAYTSDWTYCNPGDYCDDIEGLEGCGHCAWCNEDTGVAFNEGIAIWAAHVGPRFMAEATGDPLYTGIDIEVLDWRCGTPNECECDPLITEGQFAATLLDISDTNVDNDPKYRADVEDALALGLQFVFDRLRVTSSSECSPEDFIRKIKTEFPAYTYELWETGANNGYDFDTQFPSAPTNFESTSHMVGAHVWDQTITLAWDLPADDWSGPGGYSIAIAPTAVVPDLIPEITEHDALEWTSPITAPGTYYVTIRTVDRTGRWSGNISSYGPIHIQATDPLDLAFSSHPGWSDFVVVRNSNDATSTTVPAPTDLRGDGQFMYANLRAVNDATIQPTYDFVNRFILDGKTVLTVDKSPVPGGSVFSHINQGPFSVPAGRHTFAAKLDSWDDVTESDEDNNLWGKQWVWRPANPVGVNVDLQYPPPPRKDGGWESLDSAAWFNVRGIRFLPSGSWTAVVLWPENRYADHDLRLHTATTGPENGFTLNKGWSARPAGCTDAVIINRNVEPTTATTPWDAGIIDNGPYASNSHIRVVESSTLDLGVDKPDSLDVDEMLHLHDFFLPAGQAGWTNITLTARLNSQPLRLALFDDSMATGDLHNAMREGVVDPETGLYTLDVQLYTEGHYGIAVYRDSYEGNSKFHYNLTVRPSTADLSPFDRPTWAGSIVPRDQQDLVYPWESVPNPSRLYGDIQPTFAYVSFHNTGPVDAPPYRVQLIQDGEPGPYYTRSSGLAAWGEDQFTTGGGFTMPAGRHTLGMFVDAIDEVEEVLEFNNTWAGQWYWEPQIQPIGPSVVRPAPPSRSGGWDDIPYGRSKMANQSAVRTERFDPNGQHGRFTAVALLPEGNAEYNLYLGSMPSSPTSSPFSLTSGAGWGPGGSSFILIDLEVSSYRQMDAGIINGGGSEPWHFQVVEATDLGHEPYGRGPERVMESTDLLHLFQMNLAEGEHRINIESTSGTIDWGASLHAAGRRWTPKSLVVNDDAISWMNGPGEDEGFDFTVVDPGEYVLAVWKVSSADLGLDGAYRIRLESHVSEVPHLVFNGTGIREVSPNPLNPQTTIQFVVEKGGPTRLAIYSLRGELVRTLVDEELAAGHHSRVWDGRNGRGLDTSSGIYMVRLQSGNTVDHRKVTLLK